MKSNQILLAILMFAPTPAFAHPGHEPHTTIGLWAALALANLLLIPLCRASTKLQGHRSEPSS